MISEYRNKIKKKYNNTRKYAIEPERELEDVRKSQEEIIEDLNALLKYQP